MVMDGFFNRYKYTLAALNKGLKIFRVIKKNLILVLFYVWTFCSMRRCVKVVFALCIYISNFTTGIRTFRIIVEFTILCFLRQKLLTVQNSFSPLSFSNKTLYFSLLHLPSTQEGKNKYFPDSFVTRWGYLSCGQRGVNNSDCAC